MNENGRKKREWVKTAAIVFLTVMLILTFFSNTFMNYSLPEVATQYVQSGTITAKIRGSGTVESSDPYNVEVTESRKIASVAVKAGDTVQKGDVLVYLEDVESEELKAAMEELEAARDKYDNALLSAEVTASDIYAVNKGVSTATYRAQITAAQNAIKEAEKEVDDAQLLVDEWQRVQDDFEEMIEDTPENVADIEEETRLFNEAKAEYEKAQLAVTKAQQAVTEKQYVVDAIRRQLDYEGEDSENYESLTAQLKAANAEVNGATSVLNAARLEEDKKELAMNQAEKRLNDKKESGKTEELMKDLEEQKKLVGKNLANAQAILEDKKAALTEKETALTDLTAQITRTQGLVSVREEIAKAEKKVEDLRAKTIGTTITAPISGTVTTINVIAGGTTSPNTPVAVLQPEGKGFTMSFSVTNEQAKRLSVGDKAELVNAWRYDDVTVTLASIKPDKTDPGQKKLLTFDVMGNVVAGQTLNVSVGQKSANYDLIVPNSAIREDNNGKFILIVTSKDSPLGTRYTASRVDVEVLASDDNQSAISAALYGYEFVITTSTKPVEAGKLIRLANN